MATNEPIQEQIHDSGDEPVSDKSIDQERHEEDGEAGEEGEDGEDEKETPKKKQDAGYQDDEDLEEGELKDDDDDDDDEDDEEFGDNAKKLSDFTNDNNNNNDNTNSKGFSESSLDDNRHDTHQMHPHPHHHHHQNYPPHHGASGQQPPHHLYHQSNRRLSPNSQHQAEMHSQYPPNHHHFNSNSSNSNHYRYPPNDGHPPQLMNHLPLQPGHPNAMYPRGGPGAVGPMHKVNVRCRFYSKTSNKCTWGDHCRFEHRDDSPGPEFDNRPPLPGMGIGPGRGPVGPVPPPMGAAERGPYPPYPRHQPYPPPPAPHGYSPYDGYGHHHSTPPPLPPHQMPPHWRQQHSPYPSPSSAHPPESLSPNLQTPGGGPSSMSASERGPPQPAGSSGGSGSSVGAPAPIGGAPSPGYPSPSSSAVVYERKHRLAYELAPWNDNRGYPQASKYDRGDPLAGRGGGFYRNHYSSGREAPYGREPAPPPHMAGPYTGYQNYPSAYRGGPMGPHTSHFKNMSSSQRTVPQDSRRSRTNKRGHDEDESSWSDSGSEDSILGQASYSNKNSSTRSNKQPRTALENANSEEPLDQGSGTPPGEPLPEDRERQEMLLNKLKEIEDLMAKKKDEQEDPM